MAAASSSSARPSPAEAPSSITRGVVELQPLDSRTDANNEQLFPPFYRRAATSAPATTCSSLVAEPKRRQRRHEELRVLYPLIPEEDRLGYISTTALILGKMIGYGIFVQPGLVVMGSGGKGASIGLWIGCGLVSLLGCVSWCSHLGSGEDSHSWQDGSIR